MTVWRLEFLIDRDNNSVCPANIFGKLKNFTDKFVQEFSARLLITQSIKTEVSFTKTALLTHEEFRRDFFSRTGRFVYTFPKISPNGCLWVVLDDELAGLAVDCMLGAEPSKPEPKKLTHIELRLAGRVANLAAEIIAEFSSTSDPLQQTDITDQTIKPAEGSSISQFCYDVSIAGFQGCLRLFTPTAFVDQNSSAPKFGHAPLELSAEFSGQTELTENDIKKLAPGMILATDIPISEDMTLKLAGIPKFKGKLALANKNKAVSITKKI